MSYCRFSTDGHMCDVYVYEAREGYVTHVANTKQMVPAPKDWWPGITDEEFKLAAAARRTFMEERELVQIGLEHDGATFIDDSPLSCAERLQSLKDKGYQVPQSAIDALLKEAGEA